MAGPVQVAAHTRAGGAVTVPAHTRAAPSTPAAVVPPVPPQATAPATPPVPAPVPAVPSPVPNPAGSPATVPGGATVKPPQPVTGTKPADFVSQTPQTVGTNPKAPAQRQASADAEDAPPMSSTSPTGYTPYFSTY